jgi:hypothetical protein
MLGLRSVLRASKDLGPRDAGHLTTHLLDRDHRPVPQRVAEQRRPQPPTFYDSTALDEASKIDAAGSHGGSVTPWQTNVTKLQVIELARRAVDPYHALLHGTDSTWMPLSRSGAIASRSSEVISGCARQVANAIWAIVQVPLVNASIRV